MLKVVTDSRLMADAVASKYAELITNNLLNVLRERKMSELIIFKE